MDEDAPKLQVRLVGRDGRRRYDPASRDRLVAACLEPGVSVSRLAREHGVNANLVRKWIKKAMEERLLQIAGEATLSRSNVPPTLVSLPLVVRPSRIKNALVGLLGAASGLALLIAGAAAFTESLAPSGLGHGIALFAVAWPICMLGVGLTGVALTCILDACRSNPVLIVDVDGLIDKRSGASVKWTEVKDAKLRKTKYGLAAVDLHLCKVVNATQNPFRVGILGFRWVPKADHILVSIAFVNKSPHTLGHTILSLAERNCNPLRIQTTT